MKKPISEKDSTLDFHSITIAIIAAIAIAVAAVALWFYRKHFPGEILTNHSRWGEFGDFIGGSLNPVFGFLGLIALLLTITLQRQELRLSRKELELTRKELAASASALENQNLTLAQQNFETTYFNLLNRYGIILSNFTFEARAPETHGVRAIQSHHDRIKDRYENAKNNTSKTSFEDIAAEQFNKMIASHGFQFENYFRTIQLILNFIEESPFPDKKKKTYAEILTSQISKYELLFIFYYCYFNSEAAFTLKPLLEKYTILKHLQMSSFFFKNDFDITNHYHPSAFLYHGPATSTA